MASLVLFLYVPDQLIEGFDRTFVFDLCQYETQAFISEQHLRPQKIASFLDFPQQMVRIELLFRKQLAYMYLLDMLQCPVKYEQFQQLVQGPVVPVA